MKPPLAIVTMVYNEPDLLPVWAAHYRAQIGAAHCYVIDHGSDDGSVAASRLVNVAPLRRSTLDEHWRASIVSHFCNDLLERYEAVAYVDVDELLVADPRRFDGLFGLCAAAEHDVLTAFGSNVLHVPGEAPIDLARPVTAQRHWARPFSSLCKPVLARRPIQWSPGFHTADAPSWFGGLYLFHIAYVDHAIILRRQAKRRQVVRSEGHGAHHGTAPDEMLRLMMACAELPRDEAAQFGGTAEAGFIREMLDEGRAAHGGRIVASDYETPVLWPVPRWLYGMF